MEASGRPDVDVDADDALPIFTASSRPADVLMAMLAALSSAVSDDRGVFAGAAAHAALKNVQAIQQRACDVDIDPGSSAHLKLLTDCVAARLALAQQRSEPYRSKFQL